MKPETRHASGIYIEGNNKQVEATAMSLRKFCGEHGAVYLAPGESGPVHVLPLENHDGKMPETPARPAW